MDCLNIELQSSEPGLFMKWNIENHRSFLHISKSAIKGTVYPFAISCETLSRVFSGINFVSNSESPPPPSCIVICDSGEVVCVLLDRPGVFVHLCRVQKIPIWIGFLEDNLAILQSCGTLTLCHVSSLRERMTDRAQWKSVTLPLIPLCCVSLEGHLVLSDGYSSYLYNVHWRGSSLSNKIEQLPFKGVVEIKREGSSVVLLACDGRQYIKSLPLLQAHSQRISNSICLSVSMAFQNLPIKEAMEVLKSVHDVSKEAESTLGELNLYINQIGEVQRLFVDTENELFLGNISVSFLGSEGYFLNFHLNQVLTRIKFQGPWWQLNVKLDDSNLSFILSDFNMLQDLEIILKIPFNLVEKLVLNCDQNINMELSIIFSHFSCQSPLVAYQIHKEPIDILHFLSRQSNVTFPEMFSVTAFGNRMSLASSNFSRKTLNNSVCQHSTFIMLKEHHIFKLCEFVPQLAHSQNDVASCSVWVHSIPITISWEKADSSCHRVTIEGPCRMLNVAIRGAFEGRVLKFVETSHEGKPTYLSHDIYRRGHATKVVMDLETSNQNLSELLIKSMFNAVTNLVSSIAL